MPNQLRLGDCLEILPTFGTHTLDSLVTDPPAGISFMGLEFDSDKGGRDKWIDWLARVMAECLRILKPGAHGLVWAIPRTSHWTATAIENAGFQVRDVITHIQSSGMPKSKHALKPAVENWILCRKPLSESSVIKNVQRWGTGGLNVEACRIPLSTGDDPAAMTKRVKAFDLAYGKGEPSLSLKGGKDGSLHRRDRGEYDASRGRWPANIVLSGELPTWSKFFYCPKVSRKERNAGLGKLPDKFLATMGDGIGLRPHNPGEPGAYTKNNHPTVKPLALMRYLCRLITPPGGTVLDPFAGSGTTGLAAMQERFGFVGIELEQQYFDIAQARLNPPGT